MSPSPNTSASERQTPNAPAAFCQYIGLHRAYISSLFDVSYIVHHLHRGSIDPRGVMYPAGGVLADSSKPPPHGDRGMNAGAPVTRTRVNASGAAVRIFRSSPRRNGYSLGYISRRTHRAMAQIPLISCVPHSRNHRFHNPVPRFSTTRST